MNLCSVFERQVAVPPSQSVGGMNSRRKGTPTFWHQGTVGALSPSIDIDVGDNRRHFLPQDAAQIVDKAQTINVCRHEREWPARGTFSQRSKAV
jgi:hypothetical protein